MNTKKIKEFAEKTLLIILYINLDDFNVQNVSFVLREQLPGGYRVL